MMIILIDRYFYISSTFIPLWDENGEEIKNEHNFKLIQQSSQNLAWLLKHWVQIVLIHVILIWYLPMYANKKTLDEYYCKINDDQ